MWTMPLCLQKINNYFFRRVLKICKEQSIDWATSLAMSHARTLLIAYRYHNLFSQDEDCPPTLDIEAVDRFVCQKAWERLVGYTGCTTEGKPKPDAVDVDMEALIILEMRMFDRSEDAGVAGNHQWGLDVGMHQDGWYPWSNDGPEGEKNLREGNESELEVGPCFDEEELSKWHKDQLDKQEEESKAQKTTYPKPKMLSRDTAVAMRKRKAPDEIPDKQSALKSSEHKKGTALAAKCSRRKLKHDTDPTL
ncbi:hypothetical protein EDD18DRAFT_1117802 [Armillaria luteobubalina]|uniref:Uncharacterized protein n=1 Tax=Armillaria luteobubalina TaxID=153913 RepID=A0AA39T954_9AGAR|nr:hypothetical protein EDD18DRAFT_1117802 [Armillaria luteobubalina]